MLPEVESLLIVQDRDQKIHALKQELAKIPRDKARAEDKLSSDKQAVADAKLAYQENEVAIKNVELDIATRRDSIAKIKVQQFETKKNEEYTALANDAIRYEEMVDELETIELELMEKADTLRENHAMASAALAETQKLVDIDIVALEEKGTQSTARLNEVLAERAELVQKVDDSLVVLYDRLLKSKGNDPVAPLKGSQCKGCHMKVTQTTMVNVQAEKAIAQCENCGRILYSV
ncbi:MAG: C4-type zinc ribbon domain-containing protein [Rubritalea sp.]|uniref:zinc ribbon domain-containing protein n=1 Tax=Rubritalea sp. TaxID=2109375 RepID=UPI003242E7F6